MIEIVELNTEKDCSRDALSRAIEYAGVREEDPKEGMQESLVFGWVKIPILWIFLFFYFNAVSIHYQWRVYLRQLIEYEAEMKQYEKAMKEEEVTRKADEEAKKSEEQGLKIIKQDPIFSLLQTKLEQLE